MGEGFFLVFFLFMFIGYCYREYREGVKEAEEEERQARLQRQKEREQKEQLAKIINAAITTQVSPVVSPPSSIVGEIKCHNAEELKCRKLGKVDTSVNIAAFYSILKLFNRKK